MCKAGHRIVFEVDSDNNDKSCIINLKTGEKVPFKLRNHVWELDLRVIPAGRTVEILRLERDKPEGPPTTSPLEGAEGPPSGASR